MKISVKPRAEPTENITLGVPISLKQDWDQLRAEAGERGADFTATAVAILKEFIQDFRAELKQFSNSPGRTTTKPPGKRPKSVVTTGSLDDLTPPETHPPLMPNGADEDDAD